MYLRKMRGAGRVHTLVVRFEAREGDPVTTPIAFTGLIVPRRGGVRGRRRRTHRHTDGPSERPSARSWAERPVERVAHGMTGVRERPGAACGSAGPGRGW